MRVMVLGLRGFPEIQGGVETHAEHLYPLLVKLGCRVEVIVRSPYVPKGMTTTWRGVRFRRLWSPRPYVGGLEAFVHSLLGVLYAGLRRPDILHIHAIGPGLMTPLARLLGLKVVVTHHGTDYDREKWGPFERWILLTGEYLGMRYANRRIVISEVIRELVSRKYNRDSVVIPNGVHIPKMPTTRVTLNRLGLEPGRYVLQVSRFDPGKRQQDIMKAFASINLPGWKLALVGALEPADEYIGAVRLQAEKTTDVVLTGFQSGLSLQELYANAGVFVLPSSHEGLPIALLEALSYGLPVLASDIPSNLEVGLSSEHYFPLGDVPALADILRKIATSGFDLQHEASVRNEFKRRYDWERIAKKTLNVYHSMTH